MLQQSKHPVRRYNPALHPPHGAGVGPPTAACPNKDVILGSGGLVSLPHSLQQLGEESAKAGSERDELVEEWEGSLALLPLQERGQDVAGYRVVVEAEGEVAGRQGEAVGQQRLYNLRGILHPYVSPRVSVDSVKATLLIWVKEEGRTGFSKSWQGCSKVFP